MKLKHILINELSIGTENPYGDVFICIGFSFCYFFLDVFLICSFGAGTNFVLDYGSKDLNVWSP